MKKYILVVLGVFLCISVASAEAVESVSYNPARLGRFDRLKVSNQLTTKGALQTTTATFQGNGTGVQINNYGNYHIDTAEATTADFPSATLKVPVLSMIGGKATFSSNSTVGTISQSSTSGYSNVQASVLDMSGQTVTLPIRNTSVKGFGGSSMSGLTLGENTIPVNSTYSAACGSGGLRWVELTTTSHRRYKVLGCGTSSGTTGGTTCSDSTYAAAHPQECCEASGYIWSGGACKRSCTAYVPTATIKHCDNPSCSSLYSGTGQCSGSCFEDSSDFWNTSGLLTQVNHGICDTDESYPATSGGIGLAEYLGLDCETQFGERNSATTLSCAYYATSTASWPTSSGPYCTAGTLTCQYTKKTWYCNSSQSCGSEANECR